MTASPARSRERDANLLRVFILGAFEAPVQLRLVEHPGGSGRYEVLTLHLGDEARLDDVPTDRARRIRSDAMEQIMALMRRPIPAMTKPSTMGVDGVTFRVQFGDMWTSADYAWWVRAPAGWETLEEVVKLMSRYSAVPLFPEDHGP